MLDGLAQIEFQLHAGQSVVSHGRIEELTTRFSKRFRLMHGRVGVTQEFFWSVITCRTHGNADGGGGEHLLSLQHEREHEFPLEAFSNPGGVMHVGEIIEENGKLIASQARHRISLLIARHGICGAQTQLQSLRHGNQQLITDEGPQAVVHDLEAVQIHVE